jgi:hypothetical protein
VATNYSLEQTHPELLFFKTTMENLLSGDSLFSLINPQGKQADVCTHGLALVWHDFK